MALAQATLTTGYVTQYTSSGDSAVTTIHVCNTSGGAISFDLCVVPSGGSASDSTIVYKTVNVNATDTYIIDTEKLVLGNGDFIAAKDDTGSVTVMTISYVSI
jgi:hypothetical protein